MIVSEPPSSMFLAAPKKRFGRTKAQKATEKDAAQRERHTHDDKKLD